MVNYEEFYGAQTLSDAQKFLDLHSSSSSSGVFEQVLKNNPKATIETMRKVSVILSDVDRDREALPIYEDAVKYAIKYLGEDNRTTAEAQYDLALEYDLKFGKQAQAIEHGIKSLRYFSKELGANDRTTKANARMLEACYSKVHKDDNFYEWLVKQDVKKARAILKAIDITNPKAKSFVDLVILILIAGALMSLISFFVHGDVDAYTDAVVFFMVGPLIISFIISLCATDDEAGIIWFVIGIIVLITCAIIVSTSELPITATLGFAIMLGAHILGFTGNRLL